MSWDQIVGKNVRRVREKLGLTQEALAGEAGLAMRHLGRIERAEISPTVEMLSRLATALKVEPGEFFQRNEA